MMILGLALQLMISAPAPQPLPFLSPAFSEHMVMQRDKPNTLWGWGQPGEVVKVTLEGSSVTAICDEQGAWNAKIKPPKAGGPYTLKVSGSQTVEFKDILVGDVWLCTGQSNMEMGVAAVMNGAQEVADANHPQIRLFQVGKSAPSQPVKVPSGAWKVCNPTNVASDGWGGFSAVGYFFGRHLQKDLKVPIGLINSSWGGSVAEAWVSTNGLSKLDDFKDEVTASKQRLLPGAKSTTEMVEEWCDKNKAGKNLQAPGLDTSGWKEHEGPATLGEIGLGGAQSVIWFRHEFEVPKDYPLKKVQLTSASVDGFADVWLNGVHVGSQPSILVWGQHQLPDGLLKAGKNVIAVRAIGQRWGGGFNNGKDASMLWFDGGKSLSLRGKWFAKETVKLANASKLPPLIDGNPFWSSNIGNAMILPFAPLAIKGAIWYQGESNVGRGEQYSRLLPALISDWRKSFGQGDFPFYAVQLANYGQRQPQPSEDAWAELQVAQALGVTRVKNAGYVVTVDIGDAKDIHPMNKQEVGRRLALLALNKTYGVKNVCQGPEVSRYTVDGANVVISFANGEGMTLKETTPHLGFELAGPDGKFHWAKVRTTGNLVIVSSDKVTTPKAVRYAWSADPIVTLFNGAGLPAGPFELKIK